MSNYEPTRIRKFSPVKPFNEVSLGKMNLGYRKEAKTGGTQKAEIDGIEVYRAACGHHDDKLYMVDVVCSKMEYRALHACLTSGVGAKFKFSGCNGIGYYRTLEREKDFPYRTYTEEFRVGDSRANAKVHYIAISTNPSFLPLVDVPSVAINLASPRFTVPFLSPHLYGSGTPDWVPYIMDEMIGEDMLTYADCHNACCGFLLPREQTLEAIISRGVQNGMLRWPNFDPQEIYEANRALRESQRPAELASV